MDLTAQPDDRGQLIVIGAIGLALLLTVMALTLNTAVFGEIHAAEADSSLQEERGAIRYHHSADRGVGGLLVRLNREYDEYETLADELDAAIAVWNDLSRSEQLRDGTETDTALKGVTYETKVIQNESREFTERGGSGEWTLAEDVSAVRGYEMNVRRGKLVETSDCTGGEPCFTIEIEGADGNSWRLFVHDDGGVAITVESPSDGTETYHSGAPSAELNITDGVFDVGGSEEEFTTFLEDDGIASPYKLTYSNAENVNGTYEFTVDGKIVDENDEEGEEDGENEDSRYGVENAPRIEARIVAAELDVRYRSAALTYETEIEAVPGETHG